MTDKPLKQDFEFDYIFTIEVAPAKTAGAFILGEKMTFKEVEKIREEFRNEITRAQNIKHENVNAILLRLKKITIAEMVDFCRFRHCYIFPFPTRSN